ncbi:MAG: gamma-glutamyltransferase, partial [Proteobacteria bacterium]|nr:gamma-glutamyltransferase [Pseudomonadota bacterium]
LAATLTRVADVGSRDFKDGETARRIVASVKLQGGILLAKDLADYRMIRRQTVAGTFAGHRIVSMPPPSSGGVHAIEILNILRNDVNQIKADGFASPLHWHLMAEAMRRAFADRALHMGDPDFVNVPVTRLIGLDHADAWRKSISNTSATPSAKLDVPSTALFKESDSTTHISVIDPEGNAVATTQTINYTFGSCMVADGTGIVMNDEMDDFARSSSQPNAYGLTGSVANEIAPFKTPLSSMTPTLVFNGAGKVVMALGSPGGPRIISATLQTIFNRLALQMSPPDAVHAPRIHHQWEPDKLFVEKSFAPPGTLKALEAMGHEIVDVDHIGDVQAIFVSEETDQTNNAKAL